MAAGSVLQLALAGNKCDLEAHFSSKPDGEEGEAELAEELRSCDPRGRTAVDLTVLLGHIDCLAYLLQRGAPLKSEGTVRIGEWPDITIYRVLW